MDCVKNLRIYILDWCGLRKVHNTKDQFLGSLGLHGKLKSLKQPPETALISSCSGEAWGC